MKNPFERLNTEFNIKDSGTICFVYGSVIDEQYLLREREIGNSKTILTDLQFLFWNYAVKNDYSVMFVTRDHIGHCLDKQSTEKYYRSIQKDPNYDVNLDEYRLPDWGNDFSKLQNRDVAKLLVDEIKSVRDKFSSFSPGSYFKNILAAANEEACPIKNLTRNLSKLVSDESFNKFIFYLVDFHNLISNVDNETKVRFSHALYQVSRRSDKKIKFFIELGNNRIDQDINRHLANIPILQHFLMLDSNFTLGFSKLDSTMFIATPGREELTAYVEHFADRNGLVEWDLNTRRQITGFMLSKNQLLSKWVDLFDELLQRQDEESEFGGCTLRALKAIMKEWSNNLENRFGTISNDDRNALRRLEEDYFGIEDVIAAVKTMVSTYEDGLKNPVLTEGFRRHMAFLGNPGTGKTSVARLVGEIFQEKGLLSRGHFTEARADDLISENIGETALKTAEKCKEALGGVLFIDEAYAIAQNSHGKDAVASLLQFMENHRNDFCVIVAGYTTEMSNFFRINQGLESRIIKKNRLVFRDVTPHQLTKIFRSNIIKRIGATNLDRNLRLSEEDSTYNKREDFLRYLFESLIKEFAESAKDPRIWGNARVAEEMVQEIMSNANQRCKKEKTDLHITLEDFGPKYNRYIKEFDRTRRDNLPDLPSAMEKIKAMGSTEVAESIEKYIKFMKFYGSNVRDYRPHLVLTGNPGTGKTTLARRLAELLKEEGLLVGGNLIECKREDLLRGGVENVSDKFKEALNGVLFIDEAYALTENEDANGRLVVNQLLTFMENNRDNTVVVLAGYSNEMRQFMDSNPGLERRVRAVIEIPDFTPEKLETIFRQKIKELDNIKISGNLEAKLPFIFEYMYQYRDDNFGNAGAVEKFKNQMIESPRVLKALTESKDKIVELEIDDLPKDYLDRFKVNDDNKTTQLLSDLSKIPGSKELVKLCDEIKTEIDFNKIRSNKLGKLTAIPIRIAIGISENTIMEDILNQMCLFLMELNLVRKAPIDQAIITTNPAALTAPYIGQTLPQVNKFFRNCNGKLVIINNARAFYERTGNSFLGEALEATKDNLNNISERLACIIIDSKDRLDELLALDLSLANTFNLRATIGGADEEGIINYIRQMLRGEGMTLDDNPEINKILSTCLSEFKAINGDHLETFVLNTVRRVKSNQRKRLIEKNTQGEVLVNSDWNTLLVTDFK